MSDKWDRDWMAQCRWIARRKSKDPSTKVAALVVFDRDQLGAGYNGLPRGVVDAPERYEDEGGRHDMMVHAEANALLHAGGRRGCAHATLYVWPLFPCSGQESGHNCAGLIINAGITRVVADHDVLERWKPGYNVSLDMFKEAHVMVDFLKDWDDERLEVSV